MVKTALVVLSLGSVAACAQTPTTPLSDLNKEFGDTTVEIVAKDQIAIQLHVANTDGCPQLGDDLIATFDGVPMDVSRGGYDTDARGCYPIAFWISTFDSAKDRIADWERRAVASGSEMVIRDASASWTVSPTRLFTNDLVVDAANSRLVWQDVKEISTARVVPSVDVKLDGNSIRYPAGTVVTYVEALAHPVPDRCDGPTVCTVNLERTREFAPGTPR